MRDRLRSVHEHGNVQCVRACDDLFHRIDRAQNVRDVSDRNNFGARAQQLFESFEVKGALLVHRHPFDHSAFALAVEMPRHNVGMMLHDRENDFIPLADIVETET